jgi:hypothetical protein
MLQFVGGSATLTYSTYLGSTEEDRTNVVLGATMDSAGNSYITGYTNGEHFPVANPLQPLAQDFCEPLVSVRLCFDAFVVSLSPSGTLTFGTYLGGIFDEFPYDLVVRGNSLYLTGLTRSPDFPTTSTALQLADPFGEDAFLVTLGEAGAPPPQSSMRD